MIDIFSGRYPSPEPGSAGGCDVPGRGHVPCMFAIADFTSLAIDAAIIAAGLEWPPSAPPTEEKQTQTSFWRDVIHSRLCYFSLGLFSMRHSENGQKWLFLSDTIVSLMFIFTISEYNHF